MTMEYLQEHQIEKFLSLIHHKNDIYEAIKIEEERNTKKPILIDRVKPTALLMKEYPQFEECQLNLLAFMDTFSLDDLTEL